VTPVFFEPSAAPDAAEGSKNGAAKAGLDLERVEIELLLEGIYRQYGYDFRQYAYGSIRRRLWRRVYGEKVRTLSGLQERVLHDPAAMERLLLDLSVNVTAMFRDPDFYLAFRQKVVPMLRTYPFIRIWNAGCSTGEETYSVAIVLEEEGLLERSRIYATDINDAVLERAREGRFPIERMRDFTENYLASGGQRAFSEYYLTSGDTARFSPSLVEHVVYAQHNLVSDRSFNEFNVILCRNVMIYFSKALQDHVHGLLYDSLANLGVLALGQKESIKFTCHEADYEELDRHEKVYRKIR
jgi:chemotaxis protein methyltransferase CheR